MICKNKFSNLYAGYEIMGGHHIKAFFGMNVICTMNEVLKFPGFFDMADLGEYLGSTKIIPTIRNLGKTIRKTENFYGDEYDSEYQYLTPTVVPLQGIENGIVYFFFEQHFDDHQTNPPYVKRKYKFQIGVIDVSVQKALSARETIIEFSRKIRSFRNPDELDEIEEELLSIVSLAMKIRQKENGIYQRVMNLQYDKSFDFIDELSTQFKKDIKYLNERVSFYGRNVANSDKASRPDYAGPNTYTVLEREFKKIINFNFKSEFKNLAEIQKLPSLPTISINNLPTNTIEFEKRIKAKVRILKDLPDFKTKYSKSTKFEQKQSLEQRADKYSLNFTDSILDNRMSQDLELISDLSQLPVYVLIGHSNEVVTVPNFVLLSETRNFLLADSNYLCKTTMVESEDQYFILET